MSNMVERVARAIFKVSAPYRDGCCLHNPDFDKCPCSEDAVEQSRAAIQAMREPTKAMLLASHPERWNRDDQIEDKWDRMIDAALAP